MLAASVTTVMAGSSPSWLWYATRGLGMSTLIILTATVVVGIGAALRWETRRSPRFVTADLHRNLSLLAVVLLALHITTTLLDPFAQISVRDAVIPTGAAYRPVWLGLGVVAAEMLIAVAASSLLRSRVGPRTWRVIHWLAYASWPLAVVHGLGTGSDSQAAWMVGIDAACVTAVTVAVARRLLHGRLSSLPIRVVGAAAAVASLALASSWAVAGPLQPGWSVRAGTPVVVASKPTTVHPRPGGFSHPLAGVIVRASSGTQLSMRDMVDTGLTLSLRSPTSTETLPVLALARDGRPICTVPATAGTVLYAVCGEVRLTIALYLSGSSVRGLLTTSGPLG
ncbi:ferric reductase-like transmembrane domain-containing protein [Candidatus Aeolococcus gillhamiae]